MSIGDVTNQGRNGNAQNAINMARNMQQMAQQFMNLFMTEMTHQLPDKPLDQSQLLQALAAQTSVATSVGQLQIAGENNALQADQLALSAQQFLGRQVLIKTTKFYVEHEKGNLDLQYDLPANVGQVAITIKDENGNIVYQGNAPDTSKGRKTFSWDHRTKPKDNGKPGDLLPAGNYTISIDLKDKDGKDLRDNSGSSITPDIYAPQTITEIDYNSGTGNGDASVMVVYGNNIRTPLGDIERVYQPPKPIPPKPPIPPLTNAHELNNYRYNINNHNLYNKRSWNTFGFKSNNRSILRPALENQNQNLDISNNPSTLNANNQYLLYLQHRNHENIMTDSNKANKNYKKTHMAYKKSLNNAFQANNMQNSQFLARGIESKNIRNGPNDS